MRPNDARLLSLVRGVTQRLLRQGAIPEALETEDAVQAGVVGALSAAQRYDADKGASYKTFVLARAAGAIRDEARRHASAWRNDSFDALAAIDRAPADCATPERHAMHYESLMRAACAINCLPARQREVVRLRYREGWMLKAIGARFGVSEARAGQIERQAVAKIREAVQ